MASWLGRETTKGSHTGEVWDKWAQGTAAEPTYLPSAFWLVTVGEPVVFPTVPGAVNMLVVEMMVVMVVGIVVVAGHTEQITFCSAWNPPQPCPRLWPGSGVGALAGRAWGGAMGRSTELDHSYLLGL